MSTIDLGGVWKIRHDPRSQGLTDRWFDPETPGPWREVTVPGAWQRDLGPDINGVCWYRRELPAKAGADGLALLRFESVATDCWVWVNGVSVGRHVGDFVPFEFDVTGALRRDTPSMLIVRVDQHHAPRPARGVVVEHGHITKGFHDVLSLQHAGIWGGVSLRSCGSTRIRPNGLFVDADPRTRRVRVSAEVQGNAEEARARVMLRAPDGTEISAVALRARGGRLVGEHTMPAEPVLWWPHSPSLYTAEVTLEPRRGSEGVERLEQRFGFRTVETGGPGNSHILLNGTPIQIRGVLSWGHEPEHIAPAPTPAQARAEFERFRALGFNCVCMCMVYAPEHFYDLADETGMLVWQEHPVWKSRMSPEYVPEYQRLYGEFLRRDRRHPSVVIVSGTCEHEAFNAELGAWWRETAVRMLPRTLTQIQTGFLEWTPPAQTDLYDDHVYDNPGRWVRFLHDMRARVAELPPKPFVMGETIISNGWPDTRAFSAKVGDSPAWWVTRGLRECGALEREIAGTMGEATLDRFRAQAAAWGPMLRKFYAESFRLHAGNAGFVTNSVRDVPICRLGLMDDLGAWRFTPEETRPWLSPAPLLAETPGSRRGFAAGSRVDVRVGVSNFNPGAISPAIDVSFDGAAVDRVRLSAGAGDIALRTVRLDMPTADGPRRCVLTASASNLITNRWPLVSLPEEPAPQDVGAYVGDPFATDERAPEFEEKGYSSGWGLACRSWSPWLGEPALLWKGAEAFTEAPPAGVGVVLTHRLTGPITEYIARGGRCVLLANRHRGGFTTSWINLWGLLPLVIEGEGAWPVRAGESGVLLDLLLIDLTANTTRAVHSQDLGIASRVSPIVRYVYTHDSGVPNLRDAVFCARVGSGLLTVTCLDHSGEAGAWFLRRLVNHAARATPPGAELDVAPFVR